MPVEALIYRIIDDYCQRWGQVPSVIKQESTYDVFRIRHYCDDVESADDPENHFTYSERGGFYKS